MSIPAGLQYLLSFSFGAIIIILFSRRRLEQLTSLPPGEEFQIVRLISARAFMGRRAYRRAFIYYVVLLEFIYISFCTIEPVAAALIGQGVAKQFQFNNAGWPLGAALIVVGLLPSTPLVEQIELAFRRLAHRAAGIPYDFLSSVTRLEQSKIQDTILGQGDNYSSEIERFRTITNILVAAGFSNQEATFIARTELFFSIFHSWTMSPQSATIWSAESKAVLDDVKAGIVSRATRIREDIDRLIKSSLDSNYLQRMHKELSVDWETSIDPSTIQESKTYESKEQDRHELRQQWEQTVKELGIIEKQIVAIFVILAANDKEPKYEDNNALRIALQLAWREKNKPLYNTGMTAVLVGFVVCFVIVFFLTSAVEYYATHSISRALKDGVYVGLYTALALYQPSDWVTLGGFPNRR
jgi:hypothetical protein